jgi:hypothetical protein
MKKSAGERNSDKVLGGSMVSLVLGIFFSFAISVMTCPVSARAVSERAARAPSQSAAKTSTYAVKELSFFTGVASIGVASPLYQDRNNTQATTEFTLQPGIRLGDDWSVSALFQYSHDPDSIDAQNDATAGIEASSLSLRYRPKSDWPVRVSPAISALLPLNRSYSQATSYNGGVSPSLAFALDGRALGAPRFSAGFNLFASKKSYEYTHAVSGVSNTDLVAGQVVSVGWRFTRALSLDAELWHTTSYQFDRSEREAFRSVQSVAYRPMKDIGVRLSHENGGSIENEDTGESNLRIASEDSSVVSLSLEVTW